MLACVGLLLSVARLARAPETAVRNSGDDEAQGSIFGARRNPFRNPAS
jgi:hypothetical protein